MFTAFKYCYSLKKQPSCYKTSLKYHALFSGFRLTQSLASPLPATAYQTASTAHVPLILLVPSISTLAYKAKIAPNFDNNISFYLNYPKMAQPVTASISQFTL
jgi:hypothetical protein